MKRLALCIALLGAVLAASLVTRQVLASDHQPVVVVQWSNSHLMREGLLPAMAERFNREDHETDSGDPIEVVVVSCDSAVQAGDLAGRVTGDGAEQHCKGADGGRAPDPTILTPQSSDWLTDVNTEVGTPVVDVAGAPHIAETWLGIVTYREMAECLDWLDQSVGYQTLVDLLNDPKGWASHPACRGRGWGTEPLLAFTNPATSTSGRNVLVSLYLMAAGRSSAADLTVADVEQADVAASVRGFQGLVDHYMPGTIPLNTKIAQGPRAGHFFLMPEDNLVSLKQGTEKVIGADGTEQPAVTDADLVMIYPEEGSVLNAHPAAVVDASWVTAEQIDGADEWTRFLRADRQQQAFIDHGFRPAAGTPLQVDPEQFERWGLSAEPPDAFIEPGAVAPDVLSRILDSWGSVKKPAVVTFVVDVSSSMSGQRLENVKEGLERVLDAMSAAGAAGSASQVGLVAFSDPEKVVTLVPPGPLDEIRLDLADAIDGLEASGVTALFDGVARGVAVSAGASADAGATRAVVVLSDGEANAGRALDEIVSMRADDEDAITSFDGTDGQSAVDSKGHQLAPEAVRGESLLVDKTHEVQVFFLGFGEADIQIGRILAEATRAEFQGSTEENLAAVIEELSGYF